MLFSSHFRALLAIRCIHKKTDTDSGCHDSRISHTFYAADHDPHRKRCHALPIHSHNLEAAREQRNSRRFDESPDSYQVHGLIYDTEERCEEERRQEIYSAP